MKCDELVSYGMDDNAIGEEYEMYKVADVDAAIAELKAENERLKAKLENVQASMYADVVDANMEVRRLKRALFIAHAIKAKFKWWWMSECKHNESCKLLPNPREIKKFTNSAWVCSKSQEKCRAKAEDYK